MQTIKRLGLRGGLRLFVFFIGINLINSYWASAQVETILEAPESAEIGSWFGLGVGIGDEVAMVGAGAEDGVGAVYVYERINGAWEYVQRIQASVTTDGMEFGGKMTVVDRRGIIGARYDNSNAGAVFIIDDVNGVWTETARLEPNDLKTGDNFGQYVAGHGDRVVVGARRESSNGVNAGAAYVFDKIDGNWVQMAKLVSNDIQAGDFFGNTVAVWGDRVCVGGDNSIYEFQLVNGVWTQITKLTAPAGEKRFNTSISLDGNRLNVGGNKKAYVYENDGGGWNQIAVLKATTDDNGEVFGRRVDMSGDRVIVSAHLGGTGTFSSAGAAFVFEEDDSDSWGQIHELVASDRKANDKFGSSVQIAGNYAIVGAPGESFTATEQSSAYIYELEGAGILPLLPALPLSKMI